MALTISVAAASRELVTLEDVREELEVRDSSVDAIIESIITDASRVIEEFCERTFAKQTYVETLPGTGGVNLMLSVVPVISITQITKSGSVVDSANYTLQEPELGLVYSEHGWEWYGGWERGLTLHPIPNSAKYTFEATYVAGYDLPNDASLTLPHQIIRAAMITVKDWYWNRSRNMSIKSMQTAGATYTYDISHIPAPAVRLLSKWRTEA